MIIFTHSDFNLDLSNYNISFQERNSWFDTSLFSVQSFPIDIAIDDFFETYKSHNESEYLSEYTGVLNRNGKLSSAILRITDFDDDFIRVTIESGLEAFPSWQTKLSELPLQKLTVEDMRAHANGIITKTYPEVNYNFPMIHCDLYDANNPVWEHFQKIYNKRVGGNFVANTIDTPNNEVYNNNIMRPFPYLLHVLNTGIEAGNCTLHGDILTDPDFIKATLIPTSKFELKDRPGTIEWRIGLGDFTFFDGNSRYGVFDGNQEILHYGKFRIKGFLLQSPFFKDDAVLTLNGVEIWRSKIWRGVNLDLEFTTRLNQSNELRLKFFGDMQYDDIVLTITPIHLWDEDGNEIKYLVDSSEIDLQYHVPECTFGNLVTYLMKQKNYSFDLFNGNEIHMNRLQNIITPSDAVDFRELEVKDKRRILSSVDSFEIFYKDTGNENYPAEHLFYDHDGFKISDYSINDKTTQIEIPGIVLPIETINGITTAKLISDNAEDICIALYDGLNSTENTTDNVDHFKLQNIAINEYQRFFNFQLNSVAYNFTFRKHVTNPIDFTIKSKIYKYSNYHFITEMSVQRVKYDVDEYQMKTLTIRS